MNPEVFLFKLLSVICWCACACIFFTNEHFDSQTFFSYLYCIAIATMMRIVASRLEWDDKHKEHNEPTEPEQEQ